MSFPNARIDTDRRNIVSIGEAANRPFASLDNDPVAVAVERAVQELRQGRAVVVREGADSLAVAAAEVLGAEEITRFAAAFGEGAGLVLAQPRLRHMGLDAPGPMRLGLSGLSASAVESLYVAVNPRLPTASGRPARPIETAALDLVKNAYLIPAAVVGPAAAAGSALTVDAPAIASYPDRAARNMRIVARAPVPLAEAPAAEFVVFGGGGSPRDQVAIIVGNPDPDRPVLTRLHSACLTGDLFGSLKCDCGEQLRLAVQAISDAGGGLLLYLDQEGRGIGLRNKMRAYGLQAQGHDTVDADAVLGYGPDERRYAVAARMLELLGFRSVVMLTNNPDKIQGLEEAGLVVHGHRRLLGSVNPHNAAYLSTKAVRAGHLLDSTLKSIARQGFKTIPAKPLRRPPQAV